MSPELLAMAEKAFVISSVVHLQKGSIEAFARLVAEDCVKLCLKADEESAPYDYVPIGCAIDLIEAKYKPAD